MMKNTGPFLPVPGDVFEINGHSAFLCTSPQPATPARAHRPWVFYAPTFSSDKWATRGLPGIEEKWMFDQFVAAGISVAGIDVGESYGNPAGRALFTALYDELVRRRNFSAKAALLARSRGGLMLYNWAAEHPAAVACIAGIYPVGDLRSYPGLEKACSAYHLTAAELESRLADHNPIDRLASLAKAKVPLFHIHGDVDTVVPLELNSGELIARYRRLGGIATLVIPPGKGHDMWDGWFQCQALVDFVIAHSSV